MSLKLGKKTTEIVGGFLADVLLSEGKQKQGNVKKNQQRGRDVLLGPVTSV